ncbi:hypothetical protein H0E87_031553, partial [Populus deltoides]
LGLLLYAALYAVSCSATQGTLHMPMGVQAADVIHCWNGFASLGTSSFTGVVFFVAAICRLKFSLITYAIGDLLAYVLHLQSAPVSCWFWLVGLGFLAGSGWFVCAYQANSAVGRLWNSARFVLAALFLGSYGDCSHYALFVDAMDSISLGEALSPIAWATDVVFGLLAMMCGWFTTLELLGNELCLAWYAELLEAGWNALLSEAGWSNGFAAAGLWFIAKVEALYLPVGNSPGEALSPIA